MQKIIINNFGPIVSAEIEIRKILVLIGEQASGKSTIAKLIYFFKSLGDDFFESFYSSDSHNYDVTRDVKLPIRRKFYDFFGSTLHLPDFSIKYIYEGNRYLELSLDHEKKLIATFSPGFFTQSFSRALNATKFTNQNIDNKISANNFSARERIVLEQEKLAATQEMTRLIDQAFNTEHKNSLFAIAGRETTVSYEATFEAYLENTLTRQLEENRKRDPEAPARTGIRAKEQSIEESLMLNFLQEIRRIKGIFKKYGGSFENVVTNLAESNPLSSDILDKINLILKGQYNIDQWGEKIVFQNGQYVYLKDGSSGQKEVIRILQDLVLCVIEKQNVLRVVEEPEAHLFPVAQKQLIELLVYMKNSNTKNQLIITTHSPYILTVLNNLLFAHKVLAANDAHAEAIESIIPQKFHIASDQFSAYSLGNSFLEDAEYWHDIVNRKTGTIQQNYLDTVSDILSNDFNNLYSLHAQTLTRQL